MLRLSDHATVFSGVVDSDTLAAVVLAPAASDAMQGGDLMQGLMCTCISGQCNLELG